MSSVICIGSAGKDIFLPTRNGTVIETPKDIMAQRKVCFELGGKIRITDRYEDVGGCAANVAIGLVRLGVASALHTKIGDDEAGEWIVRRLRAEGVDCALVQKEIGARTDLSVIVVDEQSSDRTIFVNRDVNERLVVHPRALLNASWIFLGALHQPEWKETFSKLGAWCASRDVKIAFNPGQHQIAQDSAAVRAMIEKSAIVFLNTDEAIELMYEHGVAKDRNPHTLLRAIHALGAAWVVLTDGASGAWATDGIAAFHVAAKDVLSKDMTGAGDAFSAAFFAALLRGENLRACLAWGSANGAYVVQFYGATEGLLREKDIVRHSHDIVARAV